MILNLIQTFRGILDCKGLFSANCLILGSGGCGKTTTIKFFYKNFKKIALEKGLEINIQYFYCINFDTKSKIIRRLSEIFLFHSGKGYSSDESLNIIIRNMKHREFYLILVLDEVHLLPSDDILSFLIISETFGHHNVRVSVILVSRLFDWKQIENERLLSRIERKIVLEPYSLEDTNKILFYRYNLAFKDGLFDSKNISFLSTIVGKRKNLRHGIEILKICGQYADKNNLRQMNNNLIQNIAKQIVYFEFRADIINKLKRHEVLVLYALLKKFRSLNRQSITTYISYNYYVSICESLGIKPHTKLTFNSYIRMLHNVYLITSKLVRIEYLRKGMHSQITLDLDQERSQTLERDIKNYIEAKYFRK